MHMSILHVFIYGTLTWDRSGFSSQISISYLNAKSTQWFYQLIVKKGKLVPFRRPLIVNAHFSSVLSVIARFMFAFAPRIRRIPVRYNNCVQLVILSPERVLYLKFVKYSFRQLSFLYFCWIIKLLPMLLLNLAWFISTDKRRI